MRIVAIDAFGTRPRLRETPVPCALAPDEMLVRVRAAGMNPVDCAIVRGEMKARWHASFPLTLGSDFAGTVEKVGSAVTLFGLRDYVYGKLATDVLHDGAYADYVVVPSLGCVAPMPLGLRFTQAAALPTAAMTALLCVDAAEAAPGMRLLVVGATGGVGDCAVQLAVAHGADVTATAHDDGAAAVRARGASHVVDYRRTELTVAIAAELPGGVDSLIDVVSDARAFQRLAQVVRRGGVAVSTVGAARATPLAEHGVLGVNVGLQPTARLLERVGAAVAAGQLHPPQVHAFLLDHVSEALADVGSGHAHGKYVLMS